MSVVIALLAAAGSVAALLALCWSSWRIAGALCGGEVSALRAAAATYAAVVQVAVIVEALGTLGLLDCPLVLLLHVVTAAVVRWQVPRPVPAAAEGRPDHAWRPWMLVGGVAVPLASLAIVQSLTSPATDFDTLRYHLVNAGFWLDGHSILQLPTGFPSDAAAPGLGELFGVWLMLPTHSTELAFLVPTLFTAVTAVALVAIAEELGFSAWRGGLAATLFALAPLCYLGETDSLVTDMVVVAGVAGAALFALRAARGRRWLILAGACLGVACAAKGSGLLIGVLVIAWASLFPGRGRLVRTAVTMAIPTFLVAGVWYLRNWVELGSPIFPYGLTVAGHVVWASGPDPLTRGDLSLLAAILGRSWATVGQVGAFFLNLFGPGLVVAFVVAPAVLGWAIWQKRGGLVSILSLALILAAGYLVTPYTGAVADQNLGSATRFSLWWADFLLLGVVLVLPRWPLVLLALAGVLYGGDLALFPSFHPALIVAPEAAWLTATLTIAVVATWVLASWWRQRGHRLPRARWPALAAIPALALLLLCLQRPASDAVTAALQRVGHPDGLVVVIHDADLADIEGPYLSVPIRYAAAGSPGDLRAFTTGGQIDRFVQSVHPALVVVGDDGIETLPPGWIPPAGWRYLGPFARNSRIYEP
jgi:hypothetical protein